jgi:hypothetical protein
MRSKWHDAHVTLVSVVQVLYGKQLHPDQLKAALGSTAPAPAAPVATAVGIGPTGPHHTQQQRIMVRRVTRRSVPIVCLLIHSPIFSLNATHLSSDLTVAYRGGGFPPTKFRSFAKAEPNSQFRGIYIRNNLIRIWVLFICKSSGTPD